MNTNTITKLVLSAAGAFCLVLIGLTNIHANYLPMLGKIVSYGAAVVILAIAATDTNRRKRLN